MIRIGIIACETFERGLEAVTQDDPDVVFKEYVEFGLHEHPEKLRKALIEKVNSLEGKVDAVLLGYGICNSLKDVTHELKVPTVRLQADDCIGVLISPVEYDKERKKCAGTMYHTPYFALMGREWFEKGLEQQLPREQREMLAADGMDSMWFLRQLFDGYSRVLFIDDGLGEMEKYLALSKQFATELNLRHECRLGTLELLQQGLARTKVLARTKLECHIASGSPLWEQRNGLGTR